MLISATMLLLSPGVSTAAVENLDEALARKARYATNPWPTTTLENSAANYTWQPETLSYRDVTTGHEVWLMLRAPDIGQEIFSGEHGSNIWSYNGARIGFFTAYRPTSRSGIIADYHQRWVVNTNGSGLKVCEGYGRRGVPFAEFGWAHTEDSYYAFGSGAGDQTSDSRGYKLYKNNVDSNNIVAGSLFLDTSSTNTYNKDQAKDFVSGNDTHLVFRDMGERLLPTPNPVNTNAMYFASIWPSSATLDSWWGIARHIGPSTDNWADPYGSHSTTTERKFHDLWGPGLNGDTAVGQYTDGSSIFVLFKSTGSYPDGGPLWEDWDGDSFGAKEEIKVVSTEAGTPQNPYGLPYFGHPVFDRWGRYILAGTYTDTPPPGTRIVDLRSMTMLPHHVMSYNNYDGQHHSWTGWTDYVLAVSPAAPYMLKANKWDSSYASELQVADTHYQAPNVNYNAYPRPSQSPDGTKVGYSQYMLNGSQNSASIAWAVVYYPYPPTTLTAAYGSGVRLTWLPPKYTARGWPDESSDPAPYAREIKKYHVWRSTSQNGAWQELGSVNAAYQRDAYHGLIQNTAGLSYIDSPADGVFYYALTSEEYSGLESDELSEILEVTAAGTSVTAQVVAAKGQKNFWTAAPAPPGGFSRAAQTEPGQYRLNWTEPSDSKIRYYNIYYSNAAPPSAVQQQRIASVPVGTAAWLDWLADRAAVGYYGITSVDRYGNESTIRTTTRPSTPTNLRIE